MVRTNERGEMRQRFGRSLAMAVALAVVIAACATPSTGDGTTTTTQPQAGSTTSVPAGSDGPTGVLRTHTDSEIFSIDPHVNSASSYSTVMRHIFDTLVRRDRNGITQPVVATDWALSDDGLTWTFNLREDVYFHDGEQLTADDVVASWERLMEVGDTYYLGYFRNVESVEAVGQFEVELTTSTVLTEFLINLEELHIIPAHLKDDPDFGTNPIGSGPFMLKEWRPAELVVLTANEDYWDGSPMVRDIEFYEIRESSSIVTALINGEIDLVFHLDPDSIDTVEAADGVEVFSAPSWEMIIAMPNHAEEALSNTLVRRALWHAINTDELISAYFGSFARPARGPLPESMGQAQVFGEVEYDPDMARELLADAGFADGFTVEVSYVQGEGTFIVETANRLAAYWREIGVTTNVVAQDRATWFDKRHPDGDFGFQLTSNRGSLGTAEAQIGRIWHSSEVRFGHSGLDPDLDGMIESARQTTDPVARDGIWADIQRHVWDEAKFLWLLELDAIYGVSDRVSNIETHPNSVTGIRFTTTQVRD